MVDPMVDAEMYLSVGKIAQAIDVLQEERFAKPTDTACRVRLMQVLFEEKQTMDLEIIFREIEAIGDQDSVNVAEGILSESKEYIQNSYHAIQIFLALNTLHQVKMHASFQISRHAQCSSGV